MGKKTDNDCIHCDGKGVLVSENFPLPYICPVCQGTGKADAE